MGDLTPTSTTALRYYRAAAETARQNATKGQPDLWGELARAWDQLADELERFAEERAADEEEGLF